MAFIAKCTGWPQKVVHFSTHYIFGIVQDKLAKFLVMYQNVPRLSENKDYIAVFM